MAAPPAAGGAAPAAAPPSIAGQPYSNRRWEACQVQLMCNDDRDYRLRTGEAKDEVGSMTIDGGTTWIQVVTHGAGKVGENRTVPAALVGGANGGNTTLADRDGWYFYIDANGVVAQNPGGIEAYLTQAGVSGKDRFWIKACIYGAYTKLAAQQLHVMARVENHPSVGRLKFDSRTGKEPRRPARHPRNDGRLDERRPRSRLHGIKGRV